MTDYYEGYLYSIDAGKTWKPVHNNKWFHGTTNPAPSENSLHAPCPGYNPNTGDILIVSHQATGTRPSWRYLPSKGRTRFESFTPNFTALTVSGGDIHDLRWHENSSSWIAAIGSSDNLYIAKSTDMGETWTEELVLDDLTDNSIQHRGFIEIDGDLYFGTEVGTTSAQRGIWRIHASTPLFVQWYTGSYTTSSDVHVYYGIGGTLIAHDRTLNRITHFTSLPSTTNTVYPYGDFRECIPYNSTDYLVVSGLPDATEERLFLTSDFREYRLLSSRDLSNVQLKYAKTSKV